MMFSIRTLSIMAVCTMTLKITTFSTTKFIIMAFSKRRTKTNIQHNGTQNNGIHHNDNDSQNDDILSIMAFSTMKLNIMQAFSIHHSKNDIQHYDIVMMLSIMGFSIMTLKKWHST
jgi:hypothetical protein